MTVEIKDPELRKQLKELEQPEAPEKLTRLTMNKPKKEKKIPIMEIFGPTIQGEGSVIGYQTTFVRFGGCDYRCERCDSLHAVLPELVKANATYMTIQELIIAVRAKQKHTEWITLSGGNPCMWDLYDFVNCRALGENSMAVETQGTIWQPWLRDCQAVTVSPKGPGMGEKFEPDKFGVFAEKLKDHPGFSVKVPVFEQRDLELAVEIMQKWPQTKNRMFLSIGNSYPPSPAKRNDDEIAPGFKKDDWTIADDCLEAYRMVLEDVFNDPRLSSVRILPQMHVLLWGNQLGK